MSRGADVAAALLTVTKGDQPDGWYLCDAPFRRTEGWQFMRPGAEIWLGSPAHGKSCGHFVC